MTPEERHRQRQQIGRIGALTRWAHEPDRYASMEKVRQAFDSKFDREARAILDELGKPYTDREVLVRSEMLRKAHFARLALASANARRK